MEFTITLNCDNATFEGEPLREIARILEEQAKKMRVWVGDGTTEWHCTLHDLNGNTVGVAKLEPRLQSIA